ncbi:resolvase [Microvirga terricola]|uniref:resolvase n=1 Tax=Microvirga terricola TaxID=2719797 RepID=UPI001FEF037C|nr:resolvase [Microvirga terricola]
MEQVLLDYLRRLSFFPPNATDTDDQRPASGDRILVETHLEKVVVRKGKLSLLLKSKGDDGRELSGVEIDWSPSGGTRAREIIGIDRQTARPMRSEARERLLVALTKARRWLAEIITDPETTTQVIAAREGCSERAVRMNLNLAFLSPAIVRTVIDGALERGTGMSKMKDLPVSWIDQTKMASRRP